MNAVVQSSSPDVEAAERRPRAKRLLPRGRRLWLGVAALALIIGVAFNWSWLVAAGFAPLLIGLLPCAAMCAMHLCMKKDGDGCKDEGAADAAQRPSDARSPSSSNSSISGRQG